MTKDELYMQRVFDLARYGTGSVSPNPLVGCVITCHDRVIGEGWHKLYGGPHAEVNAVNSVEDKTLLPESTVYVNLEPCAHFGKTPPCADLLVKHQVKRVVISTLDPNPLVGGKGIMKLEEAGIEVTVGVLESEGMDLNRRFFTALSKNRPYIVLKWAETADGFVARSNYDSKWISNETSRMLVHKWRAEEDAIMVGTNTAHYDDPQLNVRDWSGRNPVRVVIDRHLRLSDDLKLFDGTQATIRYNLQKNEELGPLNFVKLPQDGFMEALFADLYSKNIRSILVEGGAQLLNILIDKNLWDEARVFVSSNRFEAGIAAPRISGLVAEDRIDTDKLLIYKN